MVGGQPEKMSNFGLQILVLNGLFWTLQYLSKPVMKIISGAGYTGLTTAAELTLRGFQVITHLVGAQYYYYILSIHIHQGQCHCCRNRIQTPSYDSRHPGELLNNFVLVGFHSLISSLGGGPDPPSATRHLTMTTSWTRSWSPSPGDIIIPHFKHR